MRFFIIFAILGSAIPGLGQACNPNLAPALSVRDKEFQDAILSCFRFRECFAAALPAVAVLL